MDDYQSKIIAMMLDIIASVQVVRDQLNNIQRIALDVINVINQLGEE